jgi:glyoxylase-like metal-dependent hydrolase (beta-lactamase superfamily II)
MWAPRLVLGQGAPPGVTRLTATLAVIDAGGANVTAFVTGEGLVVIDSGAPNTGDAVMAALKSLAPNAKVTTLFNTHYHLDQTANNAAFAAQGARIISQKRTREWLSRDYWNPAVEQYVKARPKAAWPTETFVETGTLKTGGEDIDYGYLLRCVLPFQERERDRRRRCRVTGEGPRTRLVHRRLGGRPRGFHEFGAIARQ